MDIRNLVQKTSIDMTVEEVLELQITLTRLVAQAMKTGNAWHAGTPVTRIDGGSNGFASSITFHVTKE